MSDARKCLAFPVVALPGVDHMPAKEAARASYVAAKQRLVMGVGVVGHFGINFRR